MRQIFFLVALVPLIYSSCCTRPCGGLSPEERRRELAIAERINAKIHDELEGEGFFKKDVNCSPNDFLCDSYYSILFHYTDIEDVRKVICRIVKEYLIAYNNDETIRPLLGGPITADNLNLSVYFYDNNEDTLPAPYISHVECREGQIRYYRLNDDEVSKQIEEESYEEARPLTPSRAATAKPL